MTLDRAIEVLKAQYERAQKRPLIQKPLAWALYQTWKIVDSGVEEKWKGLSLDGKKER